MKDLVEQLARRFADRPEDISIAEIAGHQTDLLELQCNSGDIGRIIGRNGKTISAMRVILNALASKSKKRVVLEVVGKE
jgi:uncharacterized protein